MAGRVTAVSPSGRDATTQVAVIGFLAFCGPGLFNALNGLGNAGSSDASIAAIANGSLYCTFAIFGYFGGAAFNIFGPLPLLVCGGLSYAVYAACIYYSSYCRALAIVGGVVLGIGAGLFWTAQGSLMMAYATPASRGRLIALFWIIFNLGGVLGGLLQFGLNYHTAGGSANPISYFAFVCTMVLGAMAAPCLLASPSSVIREDGTPVIFQPADSAWVEIKAAVNALNDPFIRLNLLFYLASNWFYTYDFNGFNGHQFNVRTRGLNSALFWGAQMVAAWLFGMLLDAQAPARARAQRGLLVVVSALALSMGLALREGAYGACNAGTGWDKGRSCKLDFATDYPGALVPMFIFVLLGAADAVYQNYAYWLMSMAAGGDVKRTVMYSAVYKGVQSAGAGAAWLIDLPAVCSYQVQGVIVLALTLGACIPVLQCFDMISVSKKDDVL